MKQLSKFVLVGVINSMIGYGVIFFFMYVAKLSPEVSNFIGYAAGLAISYLLHRHYTFKSSKKQRGGFGLFVLVVFIGYMANLLVLITLVRALAVHAALSQVVAGVVYILMSYLLNKKYVFRSS